MKDHHPVNVDLFNEMFRIARDIPAFDISDQYNCFMALLMDARGTEDLFGVDDFNISEDCFSEWYLPLFKTENQKLPDLDRELCTDVDSCIIHVKRVVEAHHGEQKW